MVYEIFISCKSEDYDLARKVYDFLVERGYRVFLADAELKRKGSAEYGKVIDAALDAASHFILIASRLDYVQSSYVENEWRIFLEEKRSGRKNGNLITILKGVNVSSLPIALRSLQSFDYNQYEDIVDFLRIDGVKLSVPAQNVPSKKYVTKNELIVIVVSLAIMALAIVLLKEYFDGINEVPAEERSSTLIEHTGSIISKESMRLQPAVGASKKLERIFEDGDETYIIVFDDETYIDDVSMIIVQRKDGTELLRLLKSKGRVYKPQRYKTELLATNSPV